VGKLPLLDLELTAYLITLAFIFLEDTLAKEENTSVTFLNISALKMNGKSSRLKLRFDLKSLCAPSPRTDHTYIKFNNCFYIYGGRDEMHIFSDIYEYSIVENRWRYIKCQGQEQVSPDMNKNQM